ncbi:AAEL007407-PB [Aedes aegypti]|uniref:AAEL007407-PB n=1 Tax=Aedes aegypti TaxID=7159 RepID=Q172E8_AEDAE|nr:AAEL007407-PB [Aedes aegypti]
MQTLRSPIDIRGIAAGQKAAQICDNRNPTTPTPIPGLQQLQSVHGSSWSRVDNPTISQSCRQDSTSSTVPVPSAHAAVDVDPGQKRWDDNRAAVADIGHRHQLLRRDDNYFKTNLTDDKFLSETVNIASNLGGDQWGQQQQPSRSQLRPNTSDDPCGCNRVNRFHMAPSIAVQNFDPLHKSIDAFLAAEREASPMGKSIMTTIAVPPFSPPPVPPPPQEFENSARFVSFTDGEFIFGPYDARSEEFQRFDLWDGDFHKRQDRHCHHHRSCKKRSPSGTSDGSTNSSSTLCLECHCQRSSVTSSETLKEAETPKLLQKLKPSQVENYDDTMKNAGNHPTLLQSPSVPLVPATYERWVHFDNGNISPPPAADQHRSPTPVRIPTPYPSPIHSGEPDDQPQCHQNVFDQFAAAFDEHQPQSKPASVDFVENVPLIDAVLDDLLTFSKTLVLRQSPVLSCPRDFPLAKEREEAKIVEINDDNLINLLADDDDNSIATKGVDETGRGLASERKTLPSKQDSTEDDASGLGWQQENSGNESFPEGKCDLNANEGRTQLEPKDHNRSADDSKDVIDNYLSTRRNHEDIFANVAIFNWNPLDVYHQHGLFMIDPRFALADLHATIPEDFSSTTHGQDDSYNERQSRASNEGHMRNDAHLNSPKPVQIQQDDGDTVAIGTVGITDGADPSSVDVNSFATQLADPATGDGCLLESHKIPNDRASSSRRSPAAVDHFYDSAHVEYPVRADLCTATIQECHQSPKESDYDNGPAKNITTGSRRSSRGSSIGSCSRRSSLQRTEISTSSSTGRDETEGLKRVAWPPPAELGDGEYQYQQQQPVQQPQQPYHYPPQQQQNQQPFQQQQHYQPAHTQPQQQHQPRERIIPIQRATSHTSPLHTPKSPVNQLKYPSYPPSSPQHLTHQQPQYQQPQQQQGGSSTVAFSGGRAVLPQKQQPARPVSAPYYQQQQQQNRYSSPSTASLASPRSPHPIGGGQSPRGWAHVQSPVPVYRPTPQQQQQNQYQQQPYVSPPFQTQPAPYQQQQHQRPTSGASAGYGHGYGPRKVHN